MTDNYKKFIEMIGENRILTDEPLMKYSSFKIGGPADLFYKALTQKELTRAFFGAQKLNIPVFIIGGGTNLLVSDKGFRGLVIKNDTSGLRIVGIRGRKFAADLNAGESREVFLESDSGVPVNRLVRFAIDQGLSGLEMFLGQPGTVGGAVYINAHNVSQERFFGDLIKGASIADKEGDVKYVSLRYLDFGYDDSIIQKTGLINKITGRTRITGR